MLHIQPQVQINICNDHLFGSTPKICIIDIIIWVYSTLSSLLVWIFHQNNYDTCSFVKKGVNFGSTHPPHKMKNPLSSIWRSPFQCFGIFFIRIQAQSLPKYFFSTYEKVTDVVGGRVWFASKNPTPCRMHWNDFLISQIIAKCHSFPNMYDML